MTLIPHLSFGAKLYPGSKADDAADYRPFMPTENATPCPGCQSTNRTYNTRGDCFCRRCGRPDTAIHIPTFTTLGGRR